MTRYAPPCLAVLAVLLLAAPPARAQSLLGAGGLGVPITPVDARGQALGNVGIGLSGASIVPTDPAVSADLGFPALTFTLRQSWVEVSGDDVESTASGARFPLIGLAYPVRDWGIATLTFNTVLDQRYDVRIERAIDLGTEEALVTDAFISEGGVSAVRLGFARRVAPSLAVGLSVGRYVGDMSRVFTRSFDSLSVESNVPSFTEGGRWVFSAPTVAAGAQVNVGEVLRVAGSVIWTGALDAEARDGTKGRSATYDLPMEFRLGASGVLAPGLQASLSMAWADWSGTTDAGTGVGDLASGEGRATLDVGGGIEYADGSIFGRTAPLRIGYRRSELPFRFAGEDPTETAWTGGVGLDFVRSGGVSLATANLALEKGERSAGSLVEAFWRATLSVRVSGL